MRTEVFSAKCIGIDAAQVIVEVVISSGLGIHLVGLADAAVKESLLRTITALQSLGFRIPGKKIVINLAPADIHKKGTGYDVPIAVGIIASSGQKELPDLGRHIIMGELGLDGSVRSIPGSLPIVEMAHKSGFKGVILPEDSALQARDYDGIAIYGVRSLTDVLSILSAEEDCSDLKVEEILKRRGLEEDGDDVGIYPDDIMDFSEIIGQHSAKRGLEIAAAGAHNVIMVGPPGSGKSSLAKALAKILPPLSTQESLQTSKVYSVAGMNEGIIKRRPFRAPHHSASIPALLGGGSDNIRPGEVSLANHGILFMDELAEAPRNVAEALRAPMEDRKVVISRMRMKVEYPASFMLVAASNPCPCGYYGEGDRCICTPSRRASYISRLSGPLMDRIDLHLWLSPVKPGLLVNGEKSESSSDIAQRVSAAREIQEVRFADEGIFTNSQMSSRQIKQYCHLDDGCKVYLEQAVERLGLSARACNRVLKIARTIADLDGKQDIGISHLSEAISYRFLDKKDIGF